MLWTIIWLVGLILAIIAIVEIVKQPISVVGKVVTILVVLLLNWIGIAIYYLIMRGNLTKWFK
jgi:hypothetical protein